MQTNRIVSGKPVRNDASDLGQQIEQVAVENLLTESAVKALNEGILRRTTGLNELKHDAMLLCPSSQSHGNKLTTVDFQPCFHLFEQPNDLMFAEP